MFVSSYLQGMITHIVCKTILDMKSTEYNIGCEDKVPGVLWDYLLNHKATELYGCRDDAVQRGWINCVYARGLMSCLQQAAIRVPIILAPILTLGSFQLLTTPLLLFLLWFVPLGVRLISVLPLSSCGLLFSGISTSPSSWVVTVVNKRQTCLPLLIP